MRGLQTPLGFSPPLLALLLTACSAGGKLPGQPLEPTPTPSVTSSPIVETATPASSPTPVGDDDSPTLPPATLPPGDDDISMPPSATPDPGDDDISLPPTISPIPGDDDTPPSEGTPLPPEPPPSWIQGAALVADTVTDEYSLIRLSDAAELWNYSVSQRNPYLCTPTSPCFQFKATHVQHGGHDFVDFAFSTSYAYWQAGVVQRVAMEAPDVPKYTLWGLDFSAVREGTSCWRPPSETCSRSTSDLNCLYRCPHDFQVLEDYPDQQFISMVLTDTENSRVLKIDLDYRNGNECGKVDWVLPLNTEPGNGYCPPNKVQAIEKDGQSYLLVTCRNTEALLPGGRISLFRESSIGSGQWTNLWHFPSTDDEDLPLLNLPHDGSLVERDDGSFELRYAHSDGLAAAWGEGDFGTIGSAWLPDLETPPDYLFEEGINIRSEQPAFRFLRDIESLPDGRRLVVDSGSFAITPPLLPSIWVLKRPEGANSPLTGHYTPDHHAQNILESVNLVEKRYGCNWLGLYAAQFIDINNSTPYLQGLMTQPGAACVLPTPMRMLQELREVEQQSSPLPLGSQIPRPGNAPRP